MSDTVQRPFDRAPEQREVNAQLRIVSPKELVTTVTLGQDRVVLGRRPDEDGGIRLNHPTVSRRHFGIAFDETLGGHAARDLGSRNGSRVSGRKLGDAAVSLSDGDVVRIGDVLTIYECGPHVAASDAEDVSREAVPGHASSIRHLRSMISRAGPDPSAVLLIGETGTGKEYIARELHRLSQRDGPFLAVNCAALSPQLIESQLFGHAKGAFTGAQQAHEGLFRAAEGGTLFLDEIGELPPELQPKLLRVLQEGEVQPVGETRPVKVDVRVLAATLRDLTELTKAGTFRLDLYARLSLWELRVPAVRHRRADLLDWIDRLVARWHSERDAESDHVPTFDADVAERLLLHDWADNLRGIDRLVHRLCSEERLANLDLSGVDKWLTTPAPAGSHTRQPQTTPTRAPNPKRPPKPTKDELVAALQDNQGSVRATAKLYQRDRRQIYRWMEQYGLRERDD